MPQNSSGFHDTAVFQIFSYISDCSFKIPALYIPSLSASCIFTLKSIYWANTIYMYLYLPIYLYLQIYKHTHILIYMESVQRKYTAYIYYSVTQFYTPRVLLHLFNLSLSVYPFTHVCIGVCVCLCVRHGHLEVRRQLQGVGSLFPSVCPKNPTQVIKLGSECLYLLIHLPSTTH